MKGRAGAIRAADVRVGTLLRVRREREGLSQEELAARVGDLGWTGSTVAKIERGLRSIKGYELLTLIHRFDWSVDDFSPMEVSGDVSIDSARASQLDADRRAAKSLGVDAWTLERLSDATWGRSFSAERSARRAALLARGQPADAQSLGHVARQMLAELRQLLAEEGA